MAHDHTHLTEDELHALMDRLQESWETILNEHNDLCFQQVAELMIGTCFTLWSDQVQDHDDYLHVNAMVYQLVAFGMHQLHDHVSEDDDDEDFDDDDFDVNNN